MYGYPTQTIQETIDSLEMVRQLFEIGVVQSGFWHQFAMTAHSPVGMFPEEFGVMPQQNFSNRDLQKIAKYIYTNTINEPEWFKSHFKNEHKKIE
jgi:hypothetical protein